MPEARICDRPTELQGLRLASFFRDKEKRRLSYRFPCKSGYLREGAGRARAQSRSTLQIRAMVARWSRQARRLSGAVTQLGGAMPPIARLQLA